LRPRSTFKRALINLLTIKITNMDQYQKLLDAVEASKEDFVKFYDNANNAAGTRVRGAMQALKALAQDIRTDVQDRKNAK
jgi:ABC-type transporter Mla subunit MlaD